LNLIDVWPLLLIQQTFSFHNIGKKNDIELNSLSGTSNLRVNCHSGWKKIKDVSISTPSILYAVVVHNVHPNHATMSLSLMEMDIILVRLSVHSRSLYFYLRDSVVHLAQE
jgi:hypothetical protein